MHWQQSSPLALELRSRLPQHPSALLPPSFCSALPPTSPLSGKPCLFTLLPLFLYWFCIAPNMTYWSALQFLPAPPSRILLALCIHPGPRMLSGQRYHALAVRLHCASCWCSMVLFLAAIICVPPCLNPKSSSMPWKLFISQPYVQGIHQEGALCQWFLEHKG